MENKIRVPVRYCMLGSRDSARSDTPVPAPSSPGVLVLCGSGGSTPVRYNLSPPHPVFTCSVRVGGPQVGEHKASRAQSWLRRPGELAPEAMGLWDPLAPTGTPTRWWKSRPSLPSTSSSRSTWPSPATCCSCWCVPRCPLVPCGPRARPGQALKVPTEAGGVGPAHRQGSGPEDRLWGGAAA